MYGYHNLKKEMIYDNKIHLMSLGLALQVPDLVRYSLKESLLVKKLLVKIKNYEFLNKIFSTNVFKICNNT